MSATVYYADLRSRNHTENKLAKIQKLCDALNFPGFIKENALTAIKLHFGERGNDTHINPTYARQIVEKVRQAKGNPFLTDTCTLYSGSRKNAVDHVATATEHGFAPSVVNAPVIIADGLLGTDYIDVPVNLKHFSHVHLASGIVKADAMIVLSHFKGHEMAGFGGAIKNLAMGCGSVLGKQAQHSTHAKVNPETCISCGACIPVCPEKAISEDNDGKSLIDDNACIGCFECITYCPVKAIDVDWATGMHEFMERMTEYAYGAAQCQKGKTAYINILTNITPHCDCAAWSDAPLVPDIGFLASHDPVALDKACYDLVNQQTGLANSALNQAVPAGVDKFKAVWENTLGPIQFTYGESIGLGTCDYELVKI